MWSEKINMKIKICSINSQPETLRHMFNLNIVLVLRATALFIFNKEIYTYVYNWDKNGQIKHEHRNIWPVLYVLINYVIYSEINYSMCTIGVQGICRKSMIPF